MKTICWDVDDVLNELTMEWLFYHNEITISNFKYSNLHNNPPIDIMPFSEYLLSLDSFRKKKLRQLKPNQELLNWFFESGEKYRHLALTAVPLSYASLSASWVIGNFGNWIRSYNFIPSIREEQATSQYDKTKADFLIRIGDVYLFIDDNENNINQVKKQNIKTILFPRPWNSNSEKDINWFINELNLALN